MYSRDIFIRLKFDRMRWEKESLLNVERRLLNASSLRSELRTLRTLVDDVAMVDDPGGVYTHPLSC